MKLLISGEGPSDIGCCNNAQGVCTGSEFTPGPMAIWLNRLLEQRLDYDLLTVPEAVIYVSENALSRDAKASKKLQALPGKDNKAETGHYRINAYYLGKRALDLSRKTGTPVIAVLFRDADGTRSAPTQHWQIKWQSIIDGFNRAEFAFGVPMLPKPKSEAWLLCATRKNSQSCEKLEDSSGNDDAPNSAKNKLTEALGRQLSASELADWCRDNPVDWIRLNTMPSLKDFFERFNEVLTKRST